MRRVGFAYAAALMLLGLGVIVSWLWTSSLLHRTVENVMLDTTEVAAITEVELKLLSYHRLSNLALISRAPEIETDRRELSGNLRTQLVRDAAFAGDEREVRLRDEASRAVEAYLQERERLQSSGLPLEVTVDKAAPYLDRAVDALHEVRAVHRARALEAKEAAAKLDSLTDVVGALVGFAFAGVLFLLGMSARRFVLAPVVEIRDAIEKYRRGETTAVAPVAGTTEIAEIAEEFNRMSETLFAQRRDRLAFLGGVAHDLRNPLATIKMGVEILKQNRALMDEPATTNVLQRIDRQLDRLGVMLGDFVDASRMEAGKLDLAIREFELVAVARELVEAYAPISSVHHVSLHTSDPELIVRGDPDRIEQVLRNLLSNAIKYSPDGGAVTVEVVQIADEVVIAVEDHGLGIPRGDVDTLFEPFHRHERSQRVAEGMGLGLSVVKRIVDAHEGRIDVTSVLEEGSTFRIWLPIHGPQGVSETKVAST